MYSNKLRDLSMFFGKILKWITIVYLLWLIIKLTLGKILMLISSLIFGENKIYNLYKTLNGKTDNLFYDLIPQQSIPKTNAWNESIQSLLELNLYESIKNYFTITAVFLIILAIIYIFRRHSGEISPLRNDLESMRLKHRIINSLGAGIISRFNKDKKIRRIEKSANRKLRKVKVVITTTLDDSSPYPKKKYSVYFKHHNNDDVKNIMEKKVSKLSSRLNNLTGGVNFGDKESSEVSGYSIFNGSIAKKAIRPSIITLIKNKLSGVSGTNDKKVEGNFTFDLNLFDDKEELIQERIVEAEKYGQNKALDVKNYLASKEVQVELSNNSIGNKTIQQTYTFEFKKSLPNTEDLEKGLENNLKLQNIQVRLESGNLKISLPLPDKKDVPIDYKDILKRAFSRSNINPTDAIFGVTPDREIVHMPISSIPHMLVAGTTGSGKSVFINSLLISMISHATPDELKIILVDPKKVEFAVYKGLPHMLLDPITDMNNAFDVLTFAVAEMERRYELFEKYGRKDIDSYNKWAKKNGKEVLPYWVVGVDEFSDLMMEHSEVKEPIIRIGQKARAAGIHLIIAMQTPRRQFLEGAIKANLPGRVSLMVANSTESQILLDETGGEKLMPKGDMWVKAKGSSMERAQSPYVKDDEGEEMEKIFEQLRNTYEAPKPIDYKAIAEKFRANDKDGNNESATSNNHNKSSTTNTRNMSPKKEAPKKLSKEERENKRKEASQRIKERFKDSGKKPITKTISIGNNKNQTTPQKNKVNDIGKETKSKKTTSKKSTSDILGL